MPGTTSPDEISAAMQELALRRGMKFDDTDVAIWRQSLHGHLDCGGLILEAVRLLNTDSKTFVNLVLVEDTIREIKRERLERAKTHMPPTPSGLSNAEYVEWIKARNLLAIKGVPSKEIDSRARKALGLPPARPTAQHPAIEVRRVFPELPRG